MESPATGGESRLPAPSQTFTQAVHGLISGAWRILEYYDLEGQIVKADLQEFIEGNWKAGGSWRGKLFGKGSRTVVLQNPTVPS